MCETRQSTRMALAIPFAKKNCYATSFAMSGAIIWNDLHPQLRTITFLTSFRYRPGAIPPSMIPIPAHLFDSDSDSSHLGYDSDSDSDSNTIFMNDSDSDSDSDSIPTPALPIF